VARGLVVGDLRVQVLERATGCRSFTIVWPEGAVHEQADAFLRTHDGSGTQRTYAFLLVDHLRWLEREALTLERVGLRDLQRYMGLSGAKVAGPDGEPWRAGVPDRDSCNLITLVATTIMNSIQVFVTEFFSWPLGIDSWPLRAIARMRRR
jgi:hypothetical protein